MSDLNLHLEAEQLEAYLEGLLDEADRALAESHLVACERCQKELEEWQALFWALEALPGLEPSPGFAERVMAGVKVARASAQAATVRWLPHTTRGWSLLAAGLALPMVGLSLMTAWILSQPWATALTGQGLLVYAWSGATTAFEWLEAQGRALLLSTRTAQLLGEVLGQLVAVAGPAGLGLAAAAFCLAALASIWVLYHNLFGDSNRDSGYAPYTI